MAVNYTFREFAENVLDCDDPKVLNDMGGRYPLLYGELSRIAGIDRGIVLSIANMMPDFVNARKANKTIESNMLGVSGDSVEEDVEEPAEEPEKEQKPAKKSVKKQEPVEEPEEDDESDGGAYDGKPAPELFKLCKARKIKAAPKKPAKYYIELLEKADEAEAKADSDADDDDDWDI